MGKKSKLAKGLLKGLKEAVWLEKQKKPKLTKLHKDYLKKYSYDIKYSEADKVYVVKVKELRSLITHGKTRAGAIKMALEASTGHVETLILLGRPVPKPKLYKD